MRARPAFAAALEAARAAVLEAPLRSALGEISGPLELAGLPDDLRGAIARGELSPAEAEAEMFGRARAARSQAMRQEGEGR